MFKIVLFTGKRTPSCQREQPATVSKGRRPCGQSSAITDPVEPVGVTYLPRHAPIRGQSVTLSATGQTTVTLSTNAVSGRRIGRTTPTPVRTDPASSIGPSSIQPELLDAYAGAGPVRSIR
jgi:hypothetical protein